jgi:hypothetical protein
MSRLVKTVAAVALASLLPSLASAAALTQGNLFVYRVGATGGGVLGGTATPVFIDEFTTAGALVQSLAMPTVVNGLNGILTGSGTATSDGQLSVAGNGQFLMLTGYDTPIGTTGNVVSNALPRTVGRLALDGTLDTTTRLTDAGSGASNNFRSVASNNGTDLWVTTANGGVRYATLGGSTSTQLATSPTTTRVVGIADGQLYMSAMTGTTRLATVGTGLPTSTGNTVTNLPGFPTGTPTASSPYGFFFADLSPSVAGLDTLYVSDDGVGGGLQKYSLNGGSWTLKGVVGVDTDDYRGLTGVVNGSTVSLFATIGGNRLVSLTDTSGYDATFSSSVVTTLATAGANNAFRGVALLPVPEPGTWALMLGGLALVAGLARRAR